MPDLLRVHDLQVTFRAERRGGRPVPAVRGVDLSLDAGEALAVLGESGSGKSVSAQAIMGLLNPRRADVSGEARFRDTDLLSLRPRERRAYRGRRVAMVFQDALAALDPVMTVGAQIAEAVRAHENTSAGAARDRAVEAMERVRIPAAGARYDSYPHQLSGGMRQRVMIAMALVLRPELLIADEPTTALDVTVQAQLMQLLGELRRETGMALLFITHDLAVAAEVADRIAVMYAGRVVEQGPAREVYRDARHPYTAGLLASVPAAVARTERLVPIVGSPPSPESVPGGCAFHPRCPLADQLCRDELPAPRAVAPGRTAACHHTEDVQS